MHLERGVWNEKYVDGDTNKVGIERQKEWDRDRGISGHKDTNKDYS